MVKNLPANTEDIGSIPGQEDPPEEEMAPTPVFLPEKSHGQRSLAGYSPWSHKESDMTEQLNTHTCACARAQTHTHTHTHTVYK